MCSLEMKNTLFKNITIIGVGLIGGSLGLSIKEKKLAGKVIGVGRRQSSIKEAKEKKVLDEATLNIEEGVKNSDLIIIATPIDKVIRIAKETMRYLSDEAILIDVASTKTDIVQKIQRCIPLNRYYVGCHPMAGSEKKGVKFAKKSIFNNACCIITPTNKTDKKALSKIKHFWEALGSKVMTMSPGVHDKVVATVSHMPHLLAAVLVRQVDKYIDSSGGSFKDATRVALSNPRMWSDIFIKNKKYILEEIDKIISDLRKFYNLIDNENRQELLNILKEVKSKREKLNEA